MSKKQAQAKKDAKSRKKSTAVQLTSKKKKGSTKMSDQGKVDMKDKSAAQEELDKVRQDQAHRAGNNLPQDNLREDVREQLDRQGPGTVHNAPEEEKYESDEHKSPDQIAHEAKERGEVIETTIDPSKQESVEESAVIDKTETKDNE